MIPQHLMIEHNCTECDHRDDGFFCDVALEKLRLVESAKISNAYSAGSMLFIEGQPANGVYLLCQGEVKLYTCSKEGKVVILHIARPGELLGLSSVFSGEAHEVSAEVIQPSQANFISKGDILRLVREHPEIAMSAIRQLSSRYLDTCHQVRTFVLSGSVADKLAQLMLDWCSSDLRAIRTDSDGYKVKFRFTHEEVSEMIGSSRETVTRVLKDFRNRGLIRLKGSDLYIPSFRNLELSIGSKSRESL